MIGIEYHAMAKQQIIIATRESPLALKQALWVKEGLMAYHPGIQVQLLGMTTTADEQLALSLATVGGKGLFVKELEEALLDGRADIAVFRPSTGIWWLLQSTSGTGGVNWGLASDVAIPNAFMPH